MPSVRFVAALASAALAAGIAPRALAEPPVAPSSTTTPLVVARSAAPAPSPRLKLSYRGFDVSNLDGSPVPLQGAQLDAYLISRRWVRLGIEAEAGAGSAALAGQSADLWYAVGGLTLGVQYPARVTPFVEGRFAVGALGGHVSGSYALPDGANVAVDARATTLMYVGGVDAGVEVYLGGRFYLSAALGWARPVYAGLDYEAMKANPTGPMQPRAVSMDTFTFKIGLGI